MLHLGKKKVEDSNSVWQKIKLLTKNKTWLFCSLATTVKMFSLSGFSFYMIEYIQETFGTSTTNTGILLGGITLITVIGGNVAGAVVLDRLLVQKGCISEILMCEISTKIALLFSFVSIGPALFIPFIKQLPLFCVFVVVGLIPVWMSTGPMSSSLLWCLELRERTFGKALTMVCYYLIGLALAPVTLGALKEAWGWTWMMFFLFSLTLVVTLLSFLAYRFALNAVKRKKLNDLLEKAGTELCSL